MILRLDLMPATTSVLIDLGGDGWLPEHVMFCYPFYPPPFSRACVALGASHQHYCGKQNWPRLNGSYWVRVKVLSERVNHAGRMEAHGSLLFDLSLTPEALLKDMLLR